MTTGKPILAKGSVDSQLMALALVVHGQKRSRKLRCILWILFTLLSVFAIFALLSHERPAAFVFLSFAAILLLLLLLTTKGMLRWQMHRTIRRQFAQMQRTREDVLYEFHDDHIRFQTKLIDTRMDWKAFCYWRTNDGLLLLYQNDNFFHVVPIDQFNAEVQTSVLTLVNERLLTA